MAVTTDILRAWRSPRTSIRDHVARGVSEPFAFALLMVFMLLALVGQWPVVAREAFLAEEPSALPRLLARGLALLATIPFWYGLAAVSRLIGRALGGQGSWYSARLALFWALAVTGPLMLLLGLVEAMIGAGPQLAATRAVVGIAFLTLWLVMLHEVERG
jgi:hypothetical protein